MGYTPPDLSPVLDTKLDVAEVNPQSMVALGVTADGATDVTSSINALLTAGIPIDGGGLTFAVSNTINLLTGSVLQNLTLKFIGTSVASTSSGAVVNCSGRSNVRVRRLKIDRNQARTSDGSGLRVTTTTDSRFEEIEVTGNGKGKGIEFNNNIRCRVIQPFVHDMTWEDDAATDDVLEGIRVAGGSDNVIEYAIVRNLLGYRTAGGGFERADNSRVTLWAQYTRGVAGAVTPTPSSNHLVHCLVENTCQGYDMPGTGWFVDNCIARDSLTWGFKQAHNGKRSIFTSCLAERAGHSGFVVKVSAASIAPLAIDEITWNGCRSINSGTCNAEGSLTTTATPFGTPSEWASPKSSGFLISADAGYENLVGRINLVGCLASDDYGRMECGINNFTTSNLVYETGFLSVGHTLQPTRRVDNRARIYKTATQSIANNTTTTLTWDVATEYDPMTAMTAAGWTCPRAGRYLVRTLVLFATTSATGSRTISLKKNGSGATGSSIGFQPPSGTSANFPCLHMFEFDCVAGDTIGVDVLQNSGGALDIAANSYLWVEEI